MKMVKSTYSGNDDIIHICPSSCWHVGHVNCRYDIIQNYIDTLDYTHRGLLLGDLAESATKDSIGKGLFDTNLTPREQRNKIIEMLAPKAEFIDGMVIGNHEMRIVKDTSIDIIEDVCNTLHIPYFGYKGFTKYNVGQYCYTVMIWHGSGKGAGGATALKRCEDMSIKSHSDVFCCGHFHKNLASDRIFTLPDTRNVKVQKIQQHFVCVGSALDYDDGYAEEIDLQPRRLGFPVIHLHGNLKHKHIEITL